MGKMRSYKVERPGTAFTAASRFRRPRQRSGMHLKWIRTLPCTICGKQGNIHAAHLRAASLRHGKLGTGIGQKPDDAWTTPLCAEHHVLDETAQHQNQELVFWRQHGIDPFTLALALWRASDDDEAGFLILREMRKGMTG
jgi:hypothetical protein